MTMETATPMVTAITLTPMPSTPSDRAPCAERRKPVKHLTQKAEGIRWIRKPQKSQS